VVVGCRFAGTHHRSCRLGGPTAGSGVPPVALSAAPPQVVEPAARSAVRPADKAVPPGALAAGAPGCDARSGIPDTGASPSSRRGGLSPAE